MPERKYYDIFNESLVTNVLPNEFQYQDINVRRSGTSWLFQPPGGVGASELIGSRATITSMHFRAVFKYEDLNRAETYDVNQLPSISQ